MILIGELSLWVALLMATWATTVSFAGGAQRRADLIASGERGIYAALAMIVLASLGLGTALITHDLSFKYVASFTSANLPLVYTLSAFWGGQAGSLLFWALILAGYSAVAVYTNRDRDRSLMPYVTGTLAVVLTFFLATLCLGVNPYERLDWGPLDGRGMNPHLQNPAMAIHPPSFYLGLAATAVPFAFAVAALITRRLDGDWMGALRRWVLVSWLFLTIGIVLGMWWAYGEPGLGGHWTRDPVENAALFPWLINTVLLHSLIAQEKRGNARKWIVMLLLSAFLLSIFAAFLARGGIISLAHSFAQSPVGNWLAGFLVLATAACIYLVVTRLPALRSNAELKSMGSRESWWRASRSTLRRRFGAHIVHAGIIVMLVALSAPAFRSEHTVTLNPGESIELRDPFGRVWQFTSQGVSQYNELNRRVVAAALDVTRDGKSMGIITSERRQYVDSRGTPTFEPSIDAGILGSLTQDVHVVLVEVGANERAEMRVGFNPLAVWVWIAGAIMAIGGVVSLMEAAGRKDE